jgi:hypothetical protein
MPYLDSMPDGLASVPVTGEVWVNDAGMGFALYHREIAEVLVQGHEHPLLHV